MIASIVPTFLFLLRNLFTGLIKKIQQSWDVVMKKKVEILNLFLGFLVSINYVKAKLGRMSRDEGNS